MLAALWWSHTSGGLAYVVLTTELTPDQKLAQIKDFFASLGPAAPLAYIAIVTIEVVVAPIPGALLYAPGGVVFGGFWGGLLSLIGNVLGAALSCQLMRLLGDRIADWIVHQRSFRKIEQRISEHGVAVIFLLRFNPLTSSDLVSYAAGLTHMPLWKLCVGTALGMAPLCWIQAYAAEQLMTAIPQLFYLWLFLCFAYAAVTVALIYRMMSSPKTPTSADHPK